MSGWWFAAGCVGLFLLLWAFMSRKWKRQALSLAGRRPNPNREQFIALLASDCDTDVAVHLWDELKPYWEPATPHPDDDFLTDLSIDEEEPQDWLERFCQQYHHDWRAWPEWEKGRPTTVRNFAIWLCEGRRHAESAPWIS